MFFHLLVDDIFLIAFVSPIGFLWVFGGGLFILMQVRTYVTHTNIKLPIETDSREIDA